MGDLARDSEGVPMEGHNISFICEDDPVLLVETLPPAVQTLFSCGEVHNSQDETRKQCMDSDSVETEVDPAGSVISGIKRGKECGGTYQSHVVSEYSEPKESSSYEPSPSFLPMSRLISAMKGGPERSGRLRTGIVQATLYNSYYWWFCPSRIVFNHRMTTFVVRPSSPDDFGELEPEVLDYYISGQEPLRGSD